MLTMSNQKNIDQIPVSQNNDLEVETMEIAGYADNTISPHVEGQRAGHQESEESNPNKRKRFNTGSVDLTSFESMSQDEKLAVMFEKLNNIEQTQVHMKSMHTRLTYTSERLQKTICHVDVNTYRTQLLAYKYLDQETRLRENNIVIYGLEERERDGVRIMEIIREFFESKLSIDDEELCIVYARRLGNANNSGRYAPKRPILCTFSHFSEVDIVMNRARRLKNTHYAIDRDYPPEIAAARKKLWPEVKRLRSSSASGDSIQMKYPAKIVHNGQIVKDAFPYWDQLMKSDVAGSFRYIMQEENAFQLHLLQSAQNQSSSEPRSMPPIPSSEPQTVPQIVPMVPLLQHVGNSGISTSAHTQIIASNSESVFRAPQIPVTNSDQRVNRFTTNVVNSDTSSSGAQQQPRPLNLVTNNIESESDIPNSQPMSPSLLSPTVSQNPGNTLRETKKQLPEASKHSEKSSSCDTISRDRSQSAGRHNSRGRPRNVPTNTALRGRSRSARPRDNNIGPVLTAVLNNKEVHGAK